MRGSWDSKGNGADSDGADSKGDDGDASEGCSADGEVPALVAVGGAME